MKRRLYAKFLLTYLLFGVLSFMAVSTVSSQLTNRYLIDREVSAMYSQVHDLASQLSSRVVKGQTAIFSQISAVAHYFKSDIWVVDKQGTVLYDSQNSTHTGQVLSNFHPVADTSAKYQQGTYYNSFKEPVISVTTSLAGNTGAYGYVVIHMPVKLILQNQYDVLNIIYIALAIFYVLSFIILWFFHFSIYRPVRNITHAAEEYAHGNLGYKIPVTTDDELGYLADTLNYMSKELKDSEESQRKFIANVSHDFRSPLTSIKGYIEAILDGTIPVEIQEKYLKIVVSETERLNKLTRNMLSLNTIKNNGVLLELSNFDINSVIKQVCETFEVICKAKKISFELTFSAKELYVNADMGKIQQVLYNLVDNAIKFSHPDSVICVEAYNKHEKIFISVKDSGAGIPKDSIKKIWDRFYKTDQSRGKDKKGTGLGLSIVKEIIQAHNENIDVISTEGIGSEFIFSLAKGQKQM